MWWGLTSLLFIQADIVAARYGVSRERQDEYSVESQRRTAAAQAAGLFDDEIVPMVTKMEVKDKNSGEVNMVDYTVVKDECNRPGTTLESIQGLTPVRIDNDPNATITAGEFFFVSPVFVFVVLNVVPLKEMHLSCLMVHLHVF